MTTEIVTRFAPSPTGFLHIGSARTALFAWVYAKKFQGEFILRIEDTDLERSTQESVNSILDAMNWLGLDYDKGPYYQTKRMLRYKEMIDKLLLENKAYYCYCSKEELDEMRELQKANGKKPKYDRRCLHDKKVRAGINPVVRFKNPDDGYVIWHDLVKGEIKIANQELDDLIIARNDGSPTYNFCVVIDDFDMQISHVIRGDDHVNNTPRQINILKAFTDKIPYYAHVPMILRDDGQKMSKRLDAVSVMDYKDMGILPEALLNYLARLCWGHGDNEIFNLEQLINWFDLKNISGSPARFDIKKLMWVNSEHIKMKPDCELSELILGKFIADNIDIKSMEQLGNIVNLVKSRVDNLNNLYNECVYFYKKIHVNYEDELKFLTSKALTILSAFKDKLEIIDWNLENIKQTIKATCLEFDIKMPELGMPLRIRLCGTKNTPSVDQVLFLIGKEESLRRLS
jgi:glutamyl-tRNA synthetase